MPKRVLEKDRRDRTAKTGIRECEQEVLLSIASELRITPSEVVYVALIKFLREERPQDCDESGIRIPVLVG